MNKKRPLLGVAGLILALLLVLAGMICGLRYWESTNLYTPSGEEETGSTKTIIRDGVAYYPRQNITTVMLLGIDETGPVKSSGSYRNKGEADVVMLLILDQEDETYTVLALNRDTMLEMDTLGVRGEFAGTAYGQLALAHTFGSGLEDSCENVKNTLTNFLPGLFVDHYLALNMDAIGIVTDLVGGVQVTIQDDFSAVDSSLGTGTVVLSGEQALNFVRARKDVGSQLNITRMSRHEEFMKGLMEALNARMEENDSFVLDLYDQVDEYMVTDCSVNVINGLMQRCADYTLKEIVSPKGTNTRGEEYYEFLVDEEALDQLALRLLYAPKK